VYLRGREELLNEIRDLEQEILAREGMHNTLSSLVVENETLRSLMSASSSELIGAGVIARPPHTPYDVMLIDRGEKDGILEDAPVYYGQGRVLGYVETVYSDHSLVIPISSPNIETSVYIFGPDIFVTAHGEGGGVVRLSIPQGVDVGVGDLVVAPSLEQSIVGDIERVESNPTEPEQHAYLTYEVPINSIRIVGVGTRALEDISYDEAEASVSETKNSFLKFEVPEVIPKVEIETSTNEESVEL
jgi:cell shape-determining protein MreC